MMRAPALMVNELASARPRCLVTLCKSPDTVIPRQLFVCSICDKVQQPSLAYSALDSLRDIFPGLNGGQLRVALCISDYHRTPRSPSLASPREPALPRGAF